MKSIFLFLSAGSLALASGAAEICDFSLNPEARDGHTPADPTRYFTVCASKRYEAHPSSVLLPDDRTILAFWDVQQAGPCGPAAISADAGRTWTRIDDRIPKEFFKCHDEPKAWRFVDPKTGRGRIRVFASYGTADEFDWRGADERPLAEAMPSIVSEDDGKTWKFLPPLGADFACAVGFSGVVRLNDGAYLGVFSRGQNPNGGGGDCRVMGSFSRDGGLTWEKPFEIARRKDVILFIPTVFRSPDGKELCCLAGSADCKGAWTAYSDDEGRTWSEPTAAAREFAGIEHSVGVLKDGRIVVALHRDNEVRGWVGAYRAFRAGRGGEGGEARFFHNYGGFAEAGSPNVHIRKEGEVVVIAHSQFNLHEPMPAVVAMRFAADEVERRVREREKALVDFEGWKPFAGSSFKPLENAKLYGPFAQELVMDSKKRRTIIPFDGKKDYIGKVAGSKPQEVTNANGTYEIAKHANRRVGNAAILVWTVRVPADCKARLMLIGSPSARCCVGEKLALSAVCADIFSPRTAEISLKQGDNDIGVMVYQPQDEYAVRAHFSGLPMRVAAALDLKDFTCVGSEDKIEIKDDDVSLDDVLEE